MKKTISLVMALLLTLSLLTACGSGDGSNSPGGGNNNTPSGDSNDSSPSGDSNDETLPPADSGSDDGNNTADAPPRVLRDVIWAYELISLEDAEALMGQGFRADESTYALAHAIVYKSTERQTLVRLGIELNQEALYDEDSASDSIKLIMSNGWAEYMKNAEKSYIELDCDPNHNIIKESDIDAVFYLTNAIDENQDGQRWYLRIFYDEYHFEVEVGDGYIANDDEEWTAWAISILIEAGNLALGRLKAIVG